jgi:uncharacterized cupin superfamily protein
MRESNAMTLANLFGAEFEYDSDDPVGYRSGVANLGRIAGGQANIVKLFELPPGQSICPYHYEYEEEWLLVVDGELRLRQPDGARSLTRGDLLCFSAGPDGAHKLTNDGQQVALAMMWSSAPELAVAVYPDSDKIGVWTGNDADKLMVRRADGGVDYWDGER